MILTVMNKDICLQIAFNYRKKKYSIAKFQVGDFEGYFNEMAEVYSYQRVSGISRAMRIIMGMVHRWAYLIARHMVKRMLNFIAPKSLDAEITLR